MVPVESKDVPASDKQYRDCTLASQRGTSLRRIYSRCSCTLNGFDIVRKFEQRGTAICAVAMLLCANIRSKLQLSAICSPHGGRTQLTYVLVGSPTYAAVVRYDPPDNGSKAKHLPRGIRESLSHYTMADLTPSNSVGRQKCTATDPGTSVRVLAPTVAANCFAPQR